jgi:hypothetical protein
MKHLRMRNGYIEVDFFAPVTLPRDALRKNVQIINLIGREVEVDYLDVF